MYPANDVFMVGKVCFAGLATIDLVAGEVSVVCESHDRLGGYFSGRCGKEAMNGSKALDQTVMCCG